MWVLLWTVVSVLVSIKLFNKLSTGKCYEDTVLSGRVAVVTGASGGIGYETALELARRGAKVVVACRSGERAERAVRNITRLTGNRRVRHIHLDLTSLASVRAFACELRSTEARVDVLINNAGAICTARELTDDGILKDLQINHLGPFLLTLLLTPMLRSAVSSRVILVSSAWHRFGTIEQLNSNKHGYLRAYANSKLCNILFSNELARRLEGSGVLVNSLNPGQVNTSLYRSSSVLEFMRSVALYAFFKTPAEGAQTSVFLAISHDCDQVTGKYFEDCREVRPSKRALDENVAARLWERSIELVKLSREELDECCTN